MIITIAGTPGAGKTSIAKILSERLGMKFYSIGDLRGRMAIEKGITIDELNNSGPESDRAADEYQRKLGETEDTIIIEGRLSWYFMPKSFKILATVSPDEGARRIFQAQQVSAERRSDERRYASLEEAKETLAKRIGNDHERYRTLYGIENYTDPTHFDLVVDTTNISGAALVADRIIAELTSRGLLEKK